MQRDGWWWQDATLSNQAIRRGLLREMLRQLLR
jgi:glutamate-1-semialdehyde 2,1-aminomutase